VASLESADLVKQVLDDAETAPISEKLKATLRFLRKMTLNPRELTADDARAVLATGVTRQGLLEAVQVAYLFNVYDRLADTLGWEVPAEGDGSYVAGAKNLLGRGLRLVDRTERPLRSVDAGGERSSGGHPSGEVARVRTPIGR
jgi:hypothetical protein